jgi:hypothetical protein
MERRDVHAGREEEVNQLGMAMLTYWLFMAEKRAGELLYVYER